MRRGLGRRTLVTVALGAIVLAGCSSSPSASRSTTTTETASSFASTTTSLTSSSTLHRPPRRRWWSAATCDQAAISAGRDERTKHRTRSIGEWVRMFERLGLRQRRSGNLDCQLLRCRHCPSGNWVEMGRGRPGDCLLEPSRSVEHLHAGLHNQLTWTSRCELARWVHKARDDGSHAWVLGCCPRARPG